MSSALASVCPTVRDALSTSDFWEASSTSGGAKEVEVRSDYSDQRLQQVADDCLQWAEGQAPLWNSQQEVAAIRRELRFLLQRARTRALLHARQHRRVARISVAITREGDHLLALMVEAVWPR